MQSKEYTVEGMSCMHCVRTIQNAVAKLSGVKQVQVSLETKKLLIEFDSSFKEQELKSALEEEGYTLK